MFALFYFGSRFGANVARKVAARTGMARNLVELLVRVGSFLVIAFGVLFAAVIVFPSFQLGDLVAGLGLSSVAIGFAFKDILQNFIAGLFLLWRQPFKVGDEIVASGYSGRVEEITARSTRIHTYDGERAVIPNADVYTQAVLVRTAFGKRRARFTVGIGYADSIEEARETIMGVLRGIDGLHGDPGPWVYVSELAGSSVNLTVYYLDRRLPKGASARERPRRHRHQARPRQSGHRHALSPPGRAPARRDEKRPTMIYLKPFATLALAPTLLAGYAAPKISWVTADVRRRGWYEMKALYPQFRGSGVARLASRDVREAANGRLAKFQTNASLSSAPPKRPWNVYWKGTVSAATDRFVSVLGTCQFDTGGAHPNKDVVGLNYAIKGGVARKISLTDIMVVRTDPVALASEFVLPRLLEMGVASVESGAVTRLTKAQADNFVMTPAGVAWVFGPGEIGPYENGTIIAKVTWEELSGKATKDL